MRYMFMSRRWQKGSLMRLKNRILTYSALSDMESAFLMDNNLNIIITVDISLKYLYILFISSKYIL